MSFANRLMLVLICSLIPAWIPGISAQSANPLQWKVLLIIKSSGDIRKPGEPDVRYQLSRADVQAATTAFKEYTPRFVSTLSGGRVSWIPTVVESDRPLRSVSKLGEGNWVAPQDVAQDIQQFAKKGEYDGIFIYWKDSDDRSRKTLRGGFGWSIGPTTEAQGGGYTCVNYAAAPLWSRESETTEVFLHEWLHQLEAFYGARGVKLPRGGLHGNENYGYRHSPAGWKHWYQPFLRGELKEKDGTRVGLGEPAWRQGTIRAEAAITTPEYLTKERQARNLLQNGSFELGRGAAWLPRSWRQSNQNVSVQNRFAKEGKTALQLNSTDSDDLFCYQKVKVKPRTRYLLSGWIKTNDVIITDKEGRLGATLSVWGTFEVSPSRRGTGDWGYAALLFNSGDKTELEVGARLGHHSSLAMGTAWYDSITLIEVPALPTAIPKK